MHFFLKIALSLRKFLNDIFDLRNINVCETMQALWV